MRPFVALGPLLALLPSLAWAAPWAWTYEGIPEPTAAKVWTLEGGALALSAARSEARVVTSTWLALLEDDGAVRWALEPAADGRAFLGVAALAEGGLATVLTGPDGPVLLALEADGRVRWARSFGSEHAVPIGSITARANGGFILLGSRSESADQEAEDWTALLREDGSVEAELALMASLSPWRRWTWAEETSEGLIALAGVEFHPGWTWD